MGAIRTNGLMMGLLLGLLGLALVGVQAADEKQKDEPKKEEPKKDDPSLAEKIDKLIKQLGDENFEMREAASKELEKIGQKAALALRKALKSEDAEIRDRARKLLDKIQTSVAYLTELLKDKDSATRKEALESLERLGKGAKEAVPMIVELLKDKNEAVKEAAILAMLAIEPEHKAIADAAPKKASVNGKYAKLLRRIKVEADKASYGEFTDYGQYSGTSWAGYNDLPPGYWVYVYPHWYIWGEQKK